MLRELTKYIIHIYETIANLSPHTDAIQIMKIPLPIVNLVFLLYSRFQPGYIVKCAVSL